MPDVLPTIPLEPVQGVQALLDTIYLYNPDVANGIIAVANEIITYWNQSPKGGIKPYEELQAPVPQFTAMYYNDGVYVASELIPTKEATPDFSKWVLVANITDPAMIERAVAAEALLREQADTELSGRITDEVNTRTREVGGLNSSIADEVRIRAAADNDLQTQIDAIAASSDVTDIVGTYAELQQYDTSKLHNNDIIKVLQDETHDDSTAYYRWVITHNVGAFELIGLEGPYYTVAETDALVATKSGVIFRDWSATEEVL